MYRFVLQYPSFRSCVPLDAYVRLVFLLVRVSKYSVNAV